MANEENSKPYDLEERTFQFAKAGRAFVKLLPRTIANIEDVKQFVRASGSVGANYIEADDSVSKKEFLKCIGICKKEARETKHFLRMAVRAAPELRPEARKLWMEAKELHLIFARIWRNGKQKE